MQQMITASFIAEFLFLQQLLAASFIAVSLLSIDYLTFPSSPSYRFVTIIRCFFHFRIPVPAEAVRHLLHRRIPTLQWLFAVSFITKYLIYNDYSSPFSSFQFQFPHSSSCCTATICRLHSRHNFCSATATYHLHQVPILQ